MIKVYPQLSKDILVEMLKNHVRGRERLTTFIFARACSKKIFHCCLRNRRSYQWKTQRWSHIGPTGRCCCFNNDPISSNFF
jgi:hypothetical protein